MKRFGLNCLSVMALSLVLPLSASAQAKGQANSGDQPPSVTIEGLVRDISCPIQNSEATATRFNLQCALDCAKNGSPLIILTKNGTIYTPISDSMPDKDQRQRLMPLVGKDVKVMGPVYERAGTHAIAIKQITEMKGVHLVTDAH